MSKENELQQKQWNEALKTAAEYLGQQPERCPEDVWARALTDCRHAFYQLIQARDRAHA